MDRARCFANQNLLLFAVLVDVALVVAKAPYWSFFPRSLVTVPEVFAKVNPAQFFPRENTF